MVSLRLFDRHALHHTSCRRKKRGTGKQVQWDQLMEQAQKLRLAGSDPASHESAELRALVSVGLRRRRRCALRALREGMCCRLRVRAAHHSL